MLFTCFYRDYLKFRGKQVPPTKYSDKRTLDLCLFAESHVIIIEAKAQQGFKTDQVAVFEGDRENVPEVLDKAVGVTVVALASSQYFANDAECGRSDVLKSFDARVSWAELFAEYRNPAVQRADTIYKK